MCHHTSLAVQPPLRLSLTATSAGAFQAPACFPSKSSLNKSTFVAHHLLVTVAVCYPCCMPQESISAGMYRTTHKSLRPVKNKTKFLAKATNNNWAFGWSFKQASVQV